MPKLLRRDSVAAALAVLSCLTVVGMAFADNNDDQANCSLIVPPLPSPRPV